MEACQVHEKVALEHWSKATKYELEGSYGDPVRKHFSFLKTAKLPRECNEILEILMRMISGGFLYRFYSDFYRRLRFGLARREPPLRRR